MAEVSLEDYDILKVDSPEDLARETLNGFADEAQQAIAEKDVFLVAVSGGTTPKRFYELLGETEIGKNIQWEKVQLFWVDERCVAPEDEKSNYGMALNTFLDKVAIPPENVHRVTGEVADYSKAVQKYEQTIRSVFKLKPDEMPHFDLIILGMGDDGHIGSLFPNSPAHFDTQDLVTAVYLMSGVNRITLTHPVICAAKQLYVLVSGSRKASILKQVLVSEPDEVKYPVHSLWPILNKVKWIIDSNAGKLL